MDDLKIPVILLLCILGGVGFYFYNKSQNPTTPKKVKPKTQVEKPISDNDSKEKEVSAETKLAEKAREAFDKGEFDKTLELLSNSNNSNNYEINRLIAYSLSSQKEFDRAILAFEKTLKIRKVPLDGYSLGYLYELTGRFDAAKALYLELAELQLPPNLKKSVYEGIARISAYLPENKLYIKYTEDLVNTNPESRDGVIGFIKLKRETNNFDSIEEFAKNSDKFFSEDYMYNYEMGQLFESAKKYNDAVNYYKKCIKLDSENFTPYFDCYRTLISADKPEQAINALERFLDNDQSYPTTYYEAAMNSLQYKRYKQAFRFYLNAVVADSNYLGKDDKGLVSTVESFFKQRGNETEKVFVNAFISYINGDYSSAMSEIERIQEELDNSVYKQDSKKLLDACNKLANIDKQRDDEQKAYEQAYNKYLKSKEEAEKQRLAAEQKANQATNKIPDNELKIKALKNINNYAVQMEIAKEFLSRSKLAEAKTYFNNASKLNKQSYEPYYEMAKIGVVQNDAHYSQKNIEEAIKCNPSDPNVLAFGASIYYKNNNLEKAKAYADSALAKSPDNSSARLVLANIYIQQQDYQSADELIEKALSVEKSNLIRVELLKIKKQIKENSEKSN